MMNEQLPENALSPANPIGEPYFGVPDEVAFEYIEMIGKYPRSKQICICGHTITSHQFSNLTGHFCRPNNQGCPCIRPRPVYFAGNARYFKRSTHGPGMKHALALGIKSMTKDGFSGEWLEQLKCESPGCHNPEILSAALERNNRIALTPQAINVFLCRQHVIELGGYLI